MNEQRMVSVELLEDSLEIADRTIYASNDYKSKLRAIIDGPGVEPVASNSKAILEAVGRAYCWPANEKKQVDPILSAAIVSEIAAINPVAPVQAVPDGMMLVKKSAIGWLLKNKPVACLHAGLVPAPKELATFTAPQPPKESTAQSVACPTDKEQAK